MTITDAVTVSDHQTATPGAEAQNAGSSNYERLLFERHSCRAFQPHPVPRESIIRILTHAQQTASWCNSQPWQVTLVTGAAIENFRKALQQHVMAEKGERSTDFPFPREYRGVYLERRRECGFQLYESVGIKRGDREASAKQALENFRLFGAPHLAIVTSDEALGTYGAIDCGAYISNFMLAARAIGVATIAQAALASQSKFIRDYFSIPNDRLVVCGISFGYEDMQHPANIFRTKRATLEQTVTWVGS
jgi:nitroreductase